MYSWLMKNVMQAYLLPCVIVCIHYVSFSGIKAPIVLRPMKAFE